jgi:glycosyltransferase involved in cell wall biosynthesis
MPNPNKIAVVCNYALNPNRIGGMDRFYVEYDTKAKQSGYEIEWYFLNYESFDFFSGLTIFSANNQNVEGFFLEKLHQENLQYTILVTHFLALCTSFFKKTKATGIQMTIAVDHNPRPLEGFPLSKIIKNKIKGVLYSKYIDQFIGVSNYTRKHILKDYGFFLYKKTTVICNGIDTAVFRKRTLENKNKFILTSHLRESKGIQDLLKALSLLREPILRQIQIDIYGEGPYEKELRKLTNDFNLNSIVNYKGSSSKLNELYAEYAFLIQPSHGETFCYSIIESLLCNVPVVTTLEAGNVLSVINESTNGFLFSAGNSHQLAIIMQNIVLGSLKIENDVSSKIETHFNLDKMVKEHIDLLQKVKR